MMVSYNQPLDADIVGSDQNRRSMPMQIVSGLHPTAGSLDEHRVGLPRADSRHSPTSFDHLVDAVSRSALPNMTRDRRGAQYSLSMHRRHVSPTFAVERLVSSAAMAWP